MIKDYYCEKGKLLIQDLYQRGVDIIHDMQVVNTNMSSYLQMSPYKLLQVAEKEKINKYL